MTWTKKRWTKTGRTSKYRYAIEKIAEMVGVDEDAMKPVK